MKINKTPNLNYLWANLIIEELVRNRIEYFCIAPGSRSTPLTIAAFQNPKAKVKVHYDERGLAFFALGCIAATKKPAVIISTSGTAAANFFPAIIETSKKKLPLIVLTADRPPELRDTGALQTIDQAGLFGKYVRWQVDLSPPEISINPEAVLTTVDSAVFRAQDPLPGPVHINCMFREPLDPVKEDLKLSKYYNNINNWINSNIPYTRYDKPQNAKNFKLSNDAVNIINQSANGIIITGKLRNKEEKSKVLELAEKLNWPVFPDIVSGLRLSKHKNIINYYHHLIGTNVLNKKNEKNGKNGKIRISTVLHFGGRITSKAWYTFIEKLRPENYIMVLGHSLRNDPLHNVTMRIKANNTNFIDAILPQLQQKRKDLFVTTLQKSSQICADFLNDFQDKEKNLNEVLISRKLSQIIPDMDSTLFLSNSMPVRDMDMYADPGTEIPIGGNRGASGIDGIIATACGFSEGSNTVTTLLIGDTAFLHDLNSLNLTRELNKKIIIVVINNNGGGIFSFLPIAQHQKMEQIFEKAFKAPHNLEFSYIAKMFNLNYFHPASISEFSDVYFNAIKSENSTIIELTTETKANFEIHQKVNTEIKKAINNEFKC